MPINLMKEFNTISGKLEMYRRLVESVHAGIYVADAQGRLVYVNSAFVNIFGYQSKDELIGRDLAEQLYFHPEDRKAFLKDMEKRKKILLFSGTGHISLCTK